MYLRVDADEFCVDADCFCVDADSICGLKTAGSGASRGDYRLPFLYLPREPGVRPGVRHPGEVFGEVAPPVRARAVEVVEAVLLGERPGAVEAAGLLKHRRVGGQRGDGAADE